MAEFRVDLKDPSDLKRISADYWTLDNATGPGWFDFYRETSGDDVEDDLIVTVRADDVRSITKFEEPTAA